MVGKFSFFFFSVGYFHVGYNVLMLFERACVIRIVAVSCEETATAQVPRVSGINI